MNLWLWWLRVQQHISAMLNTPPPHPPPHLLALHSLHPPDSQSLPITRKLK
jgi:hypothetical protein